MGRDAVRPLLWQHALRLQLRLALLAADLARVVGGASRGPLGVLLVLVTHTGFGLVASL